MNPQVLEINDIDQLNDWRVDWQRLLTQTPQANFFQSLDWLQTYWRHFGSTQKLRVLMIVEGEHLIGIVPMVVRREKRKFGTVRVLTYPLDDWGSFYGAISDRPVEVIDAALTYLCHSKCDWDLLSLRWINGETSDLSEAAGQAMVRAGLTPYREQRETTSLVDLSGNWEEYSQRWNSKFRSNLRRCQRRLEEQGAFRYERYRPRRETNDDAELRVDLFDVCRSLAEESWQGSSTSGTTLSHQAVADFLRDLHEVAARTGHLDVNLLYLDDEPIAFAYNYELLGNIFGLRCGYRPAYAKFGVGSLMFAKAIEDSFSRGDRIYDLGPGTIECKKRFATGMVPIYQWTHYHRLRPKAQLLRLKRIAQHWWQTDQDQPAPA